MALTIVGRKLEVRSDEIPVKRQDGTYAFPRNVTQFETKATINPRDYALVLEGDQAQRVMSMKQGINGLNYQDAQVKALQDNLNLPTLRTFITQYQNANKALNGEAVLYDASGKLIEGEQLRNYASRLNSDCWTWLNAGFEAGSGCLGLDLVTVAGLNKDGSLSTKKVPLEDCLQEDCWAEVESANNQGLLTRKSSHQDYEAGKVVYFYHPRKNSVAGFDADSVRAGVGCSGVPRDSYPALGVFPCAEGDAKK
jgi:hypothetical protein